MKFKSYSERKHAADKIKKETDKIQETFKKLGSDPEKVCFTPCKKRLLDTCHN